MAENKDVQAAFMEALNGLKEYAVVNGKVITNEDIKEFFKDIDIDENKSGMITGYLMANGIKVDGNINNDNEFMKMLEDAENNVSSEAEEDVENEDDKAARTIEDNLDYSEDEKYLSLYIEDLQRVEKLSDTTRAYLLMNIAEDNDKESLRLLSESFLEKIVEWIEPFKKKGVLAGDLVQEANLAMMAYVSEKRFLNNYEWKDKIKEGTTDDLIYVLNEIEKDIKSEVEGSLNMLIDEQHSSNNITGKVLNKVNLVNDWAKRVREEIGHKPTVDELAEKMGISKENIMEAINLSADNIEDIDNKNNA